MRSEEDLSAPQIVRSAKLPPSVRLSPVAHVVDGRSDRSLANPDATSRPHHAAQDASSGFRHLGCAARADDGGGGGGGSKKAGGGGKKKKGGRK